MPNRPPILPYTRAEEREAEAFVRALVKAAWYPERRRLPQQDTLAAVVLLTFVAAAFAAYVLL